MTQEHAVRRGSDHERTNGATPREALLAALAEVIPAAMAAGDTEAARVAHEALGRLLPGAGRLAGVVEIEARRSRGA